MAFEEVPVKLGKRYDVSEFVEDMSLPIDAKQKLKLILALEAANVALNELAYKGDKLPEIAYSTNLTINGTPRSGGFSPLWEQTGQPTLFIDLSSHPAEKAFDGETLAILRQKGWDEEFLNKYSVVSTMLEETYHFVDHTKGLLPTGRDKQGRLPGYENYYDQPHEHRARAFSIAAASKYFLSLIADKPNLY